MNEIQKGALIQVCNRFEAEFHEEDFHPSLGTDDGWVEGWIGGEPGKHIYVGCSPEGEVHS